MYATTGKTGSSPGGGWSFERRYDLKGAASGASWPPHAPPGRQARRGKPGAYRMIYELRRVSAANHWTPDEATGIRST